MFAELPVEAPLVARTEDPPFFDGHLRVATWNVRGALTLPHILEIMDLAPPHAIFGFVETGPGLPVGWEQHIPGYTALVVTRPDRAGGGLV